MCGGVFYNHKGQDIRVYFPNPKATLPVITKTHEIELLPWGRRKEQAGKLIAQAQASIETEKKAAIAELKSQVATLSIDIAEKVVRTELSSKGKQEQLVESMLGEATLN